MFNYWFLLRTRSTLENKKHGGKIFGINNVEASTYMLEVSDLESKLTTLFTNALARETSSFESMGLAEPAK